MAMFKYDGARAAVTEAASSSQYSLAWAETLTGSAGSDSLWGGDGDLLQGGAGDDTYTLGSLNVQIVEHADQGTDKLVAWANVHLDDYPNIENLLVGGDGRYAAGNAGDNVIEGNDASQQIYGGGGMDVLVGGGGADIFIVIKGEGNDVIQDFSADDKVRLTSNLKSFAEVQGHMSQVGADVKLDLGDGDGLMFRNITVGQFSEANFQLPLNVATLGPLTFQDEFNGPLSLWDQQSNPTGTWRPDYGFDGAHGAGSYTLANNGEKQIYTSPYFRDHNGDFEESPFVSNADGTLSIWGRESNSSEIFGYNYTSGALTTAPTFSQTYGYFEMRADLPDTAGAWPAFWLVPADGTWPPELDVMETLTGDVRSAHTTVHTSETGGHTQKGVASYIPDSSDGFHTYGTLWTATELVWYIDGVETFRTETPADMHKPMFMIANLALGGWAGPISDQDVPAEFKIDYIRAYGLDGSVAAPPVGAPGAPVPPPSAPPISTGNVLTATNNGEHVIGSAGDDIIFGSQASNTLTGGDGADTFVFQALPWSSGHITDFQLGVDKLDLSALYANGYAGADPVADGYLSFVDNGAGGTLVMMDIDAGDWTNPWAFMITTLDGVSAVGLTAAQVLGGANLPAYSPAEKLAPPSPEDQAAPGVQAMQSSLSFNQVLTATNQEEHVIGGAGNDTIYASQAANTLTGGSGADTFVFTNMPWSASHISDFQIGVDKLDFSALYATPYTGSDPVADGYLSFWDDGAGGTRVMLDIDASGAANPWPFQITILDGVSAAGLTAADVLGGHAPLALAGISEGLGAQTDWAFH